MKKNNILLQGAGGYAAINFIKSLKMTDYEGRIITIDANELTAGKFFADSNYIVPRADNDNYIVELKKIIEKEKIDLIVPTSGADLLPIAKNKKELEKEYNIKVLFNDINTILFCNDKIEFYNQMKDFFELPYIFQNEEPKDYPIFIKPNFGKGAVDSFKIYNELGLNYFKSIIKEPVIQKYISGKEYTVDLLSDFSGNAIYCVVRERVEVKAGISYKGRIVIDDNISRLAFNVANKIKNVGICNIQFKLDENNVPYLIEINPRYGGGSIFSTLAGANLPFDLIKMANNESINEPVIREITVIRYYNEIIWE